MSRRVVPLVLLLAVIVVMLVVDRDPADTASTTEADAVGAAHALPVAPAQGALSSTWFCAGGTTQDNGFADHTVIIANPGDSELRGTVSVYGGSLLHRVSTAQTTTTAESTTLTTTEPVGPPPPVTKVVSVPAQGSVEVVLRDIVKAPIASAVVEVPGGEIAVEHRIESRHGRDTAPCASDASGEWHFAYGATARSAREVLVFFNPFPVDAVIDGTFMTDDGPREPGRFDGFTVPARSTVGIDLGEDITLRRQIAASFRTRSGRVIVDRIQEFDGSIRSRGLSVRLGMPQAKPVWMFPDGAASERVAEVYVVYNPSARPAEVDVELVPTDPSKNGFPEPYSLSLLPGAFEAVVVKPGDRIAAGLGHTGIVRSLNGVGVVAERVLTTQGNAQRVGVSVTSGSPVAAPTWVFADGTANEAHDEWIYLYNPSTEFLAKVSMTVLAGRQVIAVSGLQDIELGPGMRLAIHLGERIERDRLPLVVSSSDPIVAERGLYGAAKPGFSNSLGIPIDDGLTEPEVIVGG